MIDPDEYKRLSIPFHTLSKRKPHKPVSEACDVEKKAPRTVSPDEIMSPEAIFLYYLKASSQIREAHGVEKVQDVWKIKNLELIKSLPEWKKIILRELIKSSKPLREPGED